MMKPPFKIQQGYSPVLNHSLIQMIIVSVGFLVATLIVSRIGGTEESRANALSFLLMPLDGVMFIKRPWTLFTHLFININFLSGLFNLITLFFFGKMFSDFIGTHRLWPVFIYSGISGALLAFGVCTVVYGLQAPKGLLLMGGVAPAMALLTAVMVVQPDLRINTLLFNNIPLKYFGAVFVLLGMVSAGFTSAWPTVPSTGIAFSWPCMVSYGGTIGFGILYGVLFKKNKDLATGFVNVVYRLEKATGKKPRMKVVYGRPLTDDEYNNVKKEKEATLDELLIKISQKGMRSLSKREKELLEKYSKE